MAFGNRSAATYDVNYRVNLGQFRAENAEARRLYEGGVRSMSSEAIKLSLAQDRLERSLAKTGAESRSTAAAELNLRKVQSELAGQAHRTSAALAQEERTLGRLTRGAVAGSGLFRGLGRSVAFASSSFLGGVGLVFAIRKSIEVSKEHQVAIGQLEAAVKAAGIEYGRYAQAIEKSLVAQENLGFTEESSIRSYITLVRATKDVTQATNLQAVAANIARGTGKSLEVATNAVAKAFAGQSTQLKRLIPGLDNTKKGYALIQDAAQRTAGAAAAFGVTAEGAQARFNVALHRTEVSIGTALLPAVTQYLDKAATWLDTAEHQEKIQDTVNTVVRDGGKAFRELANGVRAVHRVLGPVVEGLGGLENTGKLLLAAFALAKLRAITTGIRGIGAAAAISATEVTALAVAEERAALAGGLPGGRLPGRVPGSRLGGLKNIGAAAVGGLLAPEILGAVIAADFLHNRFDEPNQITAEQLKDPAVRARIKKAVGEQGLAKLDELSRRGKVTGAGSVRGGRAVPRGGGEQPAKPGANAATRAPALPRDQQISLDISRARSSGSQVALVRALKAQIDYDNQYERVQEDLLRRGVGDRKTHAAILQRLYGDEQSAQAEIDGIASKAADKKAAASEKHARDIASKAKKQKAARDKARKAQERAEATIQAEISRRNTKSRAGLVYDPISGFFESTKPGAAKAGAKGKDPNAPATAADFAKLSFDFLQNLHGLQNQLGSNFTGGVDAHGRVQTHLTRQIVEHLGSIAAGQRGPEARYGRLEADTAMQASY